MNRHTLSGAPRSQSAVAGWSKTDSTKSSRNQLSFVFGPKSVKGNSKGSITCTTNVVAQSSELRVEARRTSAPRQARVSEDAAVSPPALQLSESLRPFLPPGKTLELAVTDNQYSMISVRRKREGYWLRIHRMFVPAAPRIMRALARYVAHNDRRASQLLGAYIDENQHVIRQEARKTRQVRLRTTGKHHDLQAIFDELNRDRFGGTLEARITWGPEIRRRSRRSIKMGSYAVEDKLIRIHPALDHEHVPGYFVAWIVYHEMLHGKHDIERHGGRRRFHTPAFTAEERSFPEYERAHRWEKENLDRLLRS